MAQYLIVAQSKAVSETLLHWLVGTLRASSSVALRSPILWKPRVLGREQSAAFNYEERDQRVLLAKPSVDTKGESTITSRLGLARSVDLLLGPHDDVRARFRQAAAGRDPEALLTTVDLPPVACLLVDEAQFLSPQQVDDLLRIAVLDSVPVLAYGIRGDFRTRSFPGSGRLMEIAHTLEELKTICRCGRKAMFNARTSDGVWIFQGRSATLRGGYEPRVGDEVVLRGEVTEYFNQTQLSRVSLVRVVREGVDLARELPPFEAAPPDDFG